MAEFWRGLNPHIKTLLVFALLAFIIFLTVITQGLFLAYTGIIFAIGMLYWLVYDMFRGDW